jgi:hypothetical protein
MIIKKPWLLLYQQKMAGKTNAHYKCLKMRDCGATVHVYAWKCVIVGKGVKLNYMFVYLECNCNNSSSILRKLLTSTVSAFSTLTKQFSIYLHNLSIFFLSIFFKTTSLVLPRLSLFNGICMSESLVKPCDNDCNIKRSWQSNLIGWSNIPSKVTTEKL